jgi:hypothetical protein
MKQIPVFWISKTRILRAWWRIESHVMTCVARNIGRRLASDPALMVMLTSPPFF